MDTKQVTLDISQAAAHLGITEDAVRKRIKRGKLQSIIVDGRIHVLLDKQGDMSNIDRTTVQDSSKTAEDTVSNVELLRLHEELAKAREEAAVAKAEVNRLDSHVADLRKQLDARTEEMREERTNHESQLQRRDSLLLDLQKRLALPAPEEPKHHWWRFWR